MNRCLFTLLLTFATATLYAQTFLTAQQAHDYLKNEGSRADAVLGNGDKPPVGLRKAEQILRDALTYRDRPDVQALAKMNKALYNRRSEVLYDLAVVQSRLNDQKSAVTSLQQLLTPEFRSFFIPYILKEDAFITTRQDPALKSIFDQVAALDHVFNSKVLATPYRPNLSDAEKVAGLSKLWSEAKYNFAYFDHIPDVDWDKLYLEYIPKVQATASTVAYYHVLKQFYAQLRDGHTDVWVNDPVLADSVNAWSPIWAQLVQGRVFVQRVRLDSLQRTGLVPGLEIVQIDGLPAVDYANRYVRPYQSGSTIQNVDVQTYAKNLLRGPKDRPVTILFRDQTGKTFSRTLPRSGWSYSTWIPTPAFTFRILPGNVAYVQLNTFEGEKAFDGFKAAFDSIATTNALIVDMRLNDGGDSNYGWDILGYLTDKSFRTGSYSSRLYSPLRRVRGEGVVFEPVEMDEMGWPANGKKIYTKPVVVLISGITFSAAEDFCSAYVGMKRGALIGEPTGGSTGQPLAFALPGGIMARVCTKRDAYPDGTEWNGKGIQPNVLVRPTVADVQAGRDAVLEAALQFLNPAATVRKSKSSK